MANSWGIELQGAKADLDVCRTWLKPPFQPFVQEVDHEAGAYLALRSDTFDKLSTTSEVNSAAKGLLVQLNVALVLNASSDPIRQGAVVDFSSDPPRRHHFLEANGIEIKIRLGMPELVVRDATGNVVPSRPASSIAQDWVRAASLDQNIAAAMKYVGRGASFVELYKAYEALLASGYGRNAIASGEKERFTWTANTGDHRHHSANSPPARPMEIWEADSLIKTWLKAAILEVLAAHP